MRCREPARRVEHPPELSLDRDVDAPAKGRERLALDVLHGDERPAVDRAEIVDLQRVGVRELGREPRLAKEARQRLFARDAIRPDDLERDSALEDVVDRAQDLAHPADADELDDRVSTEGVSRAKRHIEDVSRQGQG